MLCRKVNTTSFPSLYNVNARFEATQGLGCAAGTASSSETSADGTVRTSLRILTRVVDGQVILGGSKTTFPEKVSASIHTEHGSRLYAHGSVLRSHAVVYHDDPIGLSLALQVRDVESFEVVRRGTEVNIRLVSSAADARDLSATFNCTAVSTAATSPCLINVPAEFWFAQMAKGSPNGFDVEFTLRSTTSPKAEASAPLSLGRVTAVNAPEPLDASASTETISFAVPSRTLYVR